MISDQSYHLNSNPDPGRFSEMKYLILIIEKIQIFSETILQNFFLTLHIQQCQVQINNSSLNDKRWGLQSLSLFTTKKVSIILKLKNSYAIIAILTIQKRQF